MPHSVKTVGSPRRPTYTYFHTLEMKETTMKMTNANEPTNSTTLNSGLTGERIEPLPMEAQQHFVNLTKLYTNERQRCMSFYYKVGEALVTAAADLNDKASRKKPTLRKAFQKLVRQLAKFQQINTRTLYKYRRLVDMYDRKAFDLLIQMPHISWTHIVHLLRVPNLELREQLVARIATQGLSVKDLKAEIASTREQNQGLRTGEIHKGSRGEDCEQIGQRCDESENGSPVHIRFQSRESERQTPRTIRTNLPRSGQQKS